MRTQLIEIPYVAMSATTPRDRTASKATVEPMLIRDMATVKRQVMRIELPGTCHFGCTYYGLGHTPWLCMYQVHVRTRASQCENGMPLSLAKAKSCREVVA